DALPKPIGITIDYLRSGRPVDTYGRAVITKQGRRVATVHAEAWQDDRSRLIAAAHGHFLLKPADEPAGK
ncbi:MAG TPA: thioesterase, partial [Rhodobiaceae bacterium]|nr:thioesterase [Rhodobiaceae bacterium]